MSTATTSAPDDAEEGVVDAKAARKARIDARKDEILNDLVRRAQTADRKAAKRDSTFQPRTEPHLRAELADEAKKKATSEVRAQDWTERRQAAARAVRSDVATVVHRNRKQLAPWLLAAPFAVAGAAGSLAAVRGNPFAIAAVFTAVTAALAWWAWTRGAGTRLAPLSQRVPAKYHRRVRRGAVVALGFVAVMPLHSWDSPHMATPWLAFGLTVAIVAAPWWRAVAHPIPAKHKEDDTTVPPLVPEPDPDELDAQHKRISGMLSGWASNVASDVIPGSTMSAWDQNSAVESYRIELDRSGNVVAGDVARHIQKIAMRLGVMADKLSFEPDTSDPGVVWMRHVVATPSYDYTGPVVLANGKVVHSRHEVPYGAVIDIVVGHYVDGTGDATYRLTDGSGVFSGFILASMGGGKSVLMDVLGVALRMLGVHLIYVDGQDGASSIALAENANEFYGSTPDEVAKLWARLDAFRDARNAQLREDKSLRSQYPYDPHRPPMIVIIEECHAVTGQAYPKREDGSRPFKTYGEALGDFVREARKLGGGLVLASQDFDLTTMGNSAPLRDGVVAGNNLFTLRFTERSRGGMLPPTTPPLASLPKGGFGYQPTGDRPSAMYRVPSLVYGGDRQPDRAAGQAYPEEWMASYEPSTLDEKTRAEMDRAQPAPLGTGDEDGSAARASLAAVPAVTTLPTFGDTDDDGDEPGGPTEADVQAAAVLDRQPISDKERQLLEVLGFDGQEWTASYVADQLGVSRTAVTKRLERAAERGLVAKTEAAKWINRKREDEV